MKWIGLTGGIASGKSTVAQMLVQKGLPVLDADRLARAALAPGQPASQAVLERWGDQVRGASPDEVDRAKVGAIVFQDEKERIWLEGLVHPEVRRAAQAFRDNGEKSGWPVAVYDVPLLFEKKMESSFDAVLLVWADHEDQVDRLVRRNGLSREEARSRISAQMATAEKRSRTPWQINNPRSDDWEKTLEREVVRVWNEMVGSLGIYHRIG